jgi:hypothetical protein
MVLRTRSDTAKEIKILVLRHNLVGFPKSARASVQRRSAAEHDRGVSHCLLYLIFSWLVSWLTLLARA